MADRKISEDSAVLRYGEGIDWEYQWQRRQQRKKQLKVGFPTH